MNDIGSQRTLGSAVGQFSDLIGAIYDCAIDPALWPQTIGAIAEAVGCFAGLIGVTDLKTRTSLPGIHVFVEQARRGWPGQARP